MRILIIFLLLVVCARSYGGAISTFDCEKIASAIFKVEGGYGTKYPYGIISIRTKNPRQICLNTIRNNWQRWQAANKPNNFVKYLGGKYCPNKIGNKDWINNMTAILGKDYVEKLGR